jgi:acetyltransferase-like isoleucine patch superfamily enzyme
MRDAANTVDRILTGLHRIKTQTYYRAILGSVGRHTTIKRPTLLRGGRWITIGDHTFIRDGARIEAIHRDGEPEPAITIGNGVFLEQNVHMVCSSRITIGDNVAIAAGSSIVDTTHPFPSDDGGNVGTRLLPGYGFVEIGEGTMLGVGVVVLSNVRIGARCVIGANSVVTSDVPDGSVAAGVPARIIRSLENVDD